MYLRGFEPLPKVTICKIYVIRFYRKSQNDKIATELTLSQILKI